MKFFTFLVIFFCTAETSNFTSSTFPSFFTSFLFIWFHKVWAWSSPLAGYCISISVLFACFSRFWSWYMKLFQLDSFCFLICFSPFTIISWQNERAHGFSLSSYLLLFDDFSLLSGYCSQLYISLPSSNFALKLFIKIT